MIIIFRRDRNENSQRYLKPSASYHINWCKSRISSNCTICVFDRCNLPMWTKTHDVFTTQHRLPSLPTDFGYANEPPNQKSVEKIHQLRSNHPVSTFFEGGNGGKCTPIQKTRQLTPHKVATSALPIFSWHFNQLTAPPEKSRGQAFVFFGYPFYENKSHESLFGGFFCSLKNDLRDPWDLIPLSCFLFCAYDHINDALSKPW